MRLLRSSRLPMCVNSSRYSPQDHFWPGLNLPVLMMTSDTETFSYGLRSHVRPMPEYRPAS